MNLTDIIMIGIGLSMDAVAVSLTNGMVYRMGQDKKFMMPVFFGVFQGLMPLLGYFTGGLFAKWLEQYSGLIIFLILGFLGAKMIKEGLSHEQAEKKEPSVMTYGVLFVQAIATSIDAFAVGIVFCAKGCLKTRITRRMPTVKFAQSVKSHIRAARTSAHIAHPKRVPFAAFWEWQKPSGGALPSPLFCFLSAPVLASSFL